MQLLQVYHPKCNNTLQFTEAAIKLAVYEDIETKQEGKYYYVLCPYCNLKIQLKGKLPEE